MSITRFLLINANGSVESGANYAGCARDHPELCDPQHHASLTEAVAYATAHGEIPVTVASADDAFKIIEAGGLAGGFSWGELAAGAIGGYFLYRALRRRSASA